MQFAENVALTIRRRGWQLRREKWCRRDTVVHDEAATVPGHEGPNGEVDSVAAHSQALGVGQAGRTLGGQRRSESLSMAEDYFLLVLYLTSN